MMKSMIVLLGAAWVALGGESPVYEQSNSIHGGQPSQHLVSGGKWSDAAPTGYTLQSGYEGLLLPAEPPTHELADLFDPLSVISAVAPLGKLGLKLAAKLGLWAAGFASLFLIGAAFTTAVCSFTPLCHISFLGLHGFKSESVRALLTQDRLNQATDFLFNAIHKYKNLQKKVKA